MGFLLALKRYTKCYDQKTLNYSGLQINEATLEPFGAHNPKLFLVCSQDDDSDSLKLSWMEPWSPNCLGVLEPLGL